MSSSDGIQALKCADCARSDSAATDAVPTGALAIPTEAMLGFPGGRPEGRGLTRRRMLANGAAGVAAVYGASRLNWESVWSSVAAQAAEPMKKSLVIIYLNGGADVLNAIVPTAAAQYANYAANRPTIKRGIDPAATMGVGTTLFDAAGGANPDGLAFANPLVSGAGLGKNGDSRGLDTMYAAGDLAVFPAADFSPDNQSHFEARDYWFAGALQKLPTGWIGRYLDLYGSKDNPLQAISLDTNLSKQIRSNIAPVCALNNLDGVRFEVPNVGMDVADPTEQVRKLVATRAADGNAGLQRAKDMWGLTCDVSARLGTLSSTPGAGYPPNSGLSERLQLAATLLGAGLGTQFVTIDWGSFDTHGSELTAMDPQLNVLGRALAAFQADLAARGIEQNVTTLVFSEFGRRVGENDSQGTDHGAGGLMLLSGSSVRGGVCGELYDLPAPRAGGVPATDANVTVATDFRTVYSNIIAEWLGADPTSVLPSIPGVVNRADGTATLFS
jgi:uncharacterized protein (DUF1501 family)